MSRAPPASLADASRSALQGVIQGKRKHTAPSVQPNFPAAPSVQANHAGWQPSAEDTEAFVSALGDGSASHQGSSSVAWLRRFEEGGSGAEDEVQGQGAEGGDDDDDDEGIWEQNGDEDEDEDMWEDAVAATDDSLLPAGAGAVDVEIQVEVEPEVIDADAEDSPDEAEVKRARTEQRQRQQRKNRTKQRKAEVLHRVTLQCWLAHASLLNAQADDPLLQSQLLSLLPHELLPSGGGGASGGDGASGGGGGSASASASASASRVRLGEDYLLSVSHWLLAYLRDRPAALPPLTSPVAIAGRGRGRGRGPGRGLLAPPDLAEGAPAAASSGLADAAEAAAVARNWELLRLLEAGSAAAAPSWASAAVGAAAVELRALWRRGLAPPGVLPHFSLPHPSATTAGAAPLRLMADSLEQQQQRPAPANADEGGALCRALLRRQGSDAQRVLLLLAMLRAVGAAAPPRPAPDAPRTATPPAARCPLPHPKAASARPHLRLCPRARLPPLRRARARRLSRQARQQLAPAAALGAQGQGRPGGGRQGR